MSMITYEEFKKLDLKVATIEEVNIHPRADRLYVLSVKIGDVRKQLVAGIRGSYSEEALKGKQVVVVDNLEPALIRGVESQGMILAASDTGGLAVITPDRRVQEGSPVK